ncbi:hypothetical protein D3C73_173740 [compost metagenome]|jgi:hypothetical protein
MTIHFNSKQSLVNYINAANSSPLTVDELDFGTPQPTAGTWREGLVNANTAIKITAKEASVFQGSRVICYDRLNLPDLSTLANGLSVKCYQPATNFDVLPALFRRYGIVLSKEDFIEEPFAHDGANPTPCVFKAKPGAIGWTGQLTVMSQSGSAVLGQHLTQAALPGLNYPVTGDGSQGSALTYLYGYDFTAYKSTLENYQVGTKLGAADTALLAAIKAIDTNAGKSLWNLDPASTAWSLEGAEVVYSGINSNVLPTNQSYKYALGLLLKATNITPPGVCYLHYDDPFDPNEV